MSSQTKRCCNINPIIIGQYSRIRSSLRRPFRISAHQIRKVRLASVALRSTGADIWRSIAAAISIWRGLVWRGGWPRAARDRDAHGRRPRGRRDRGHDGRRRCQHTPSLQRSIKLSVNGLHRRSRFPDRKIESSHPSQGLCHISGFYLLVLSSGRESGYAIPMP